MKFPASGHGLKNTKVLFNFLLIVNVFHSNCSLFIKKWSTSAFNSCVSLCWFGHYLADMNSSRCEKIDGKKIIPLICWRIQYSKKAAMRECNVFLWKDTFKKPFIYQSSAFRAWSVNVFDSFMLFTTKKEQSSNAYWSKIPYKNHNLWMSSDFKCIYWKSCQSKQ